MAALQSQLPLVFDDAASLHLQPSSNNLHRVLRSSLLPVRRLSSLQFTLPPLSVRASLGCPFTTSLCRSLVTAQRSVENGGESVGRDEDEDILFLEDQGESSWISGSQLLTATTAFLLAAGPALANEELTRFSPDEWTNIFITTGIWVVLYFLVIPAITFNYLRLRWYKRSTAETYFQFMLVFIFFPGMLLLAPFINFRRLPNDGAGEP